MIWLSDFNRHHLLWEPVENRHLNSLEDETRLLIHLLGAYHMEMAAVLLNVVLKQCIDILIDHLYYIFRAVFELNVYHSSWLISTTLVLRRPEKPYKVAKAYWPIGLLNTIGKLLSMLVTADLSFLPEKHNMLDAQVTTPLIGLQNQGCIEGQQSCLHPFS
ncbi:hypothetical protein J132_00729 [Termitomyces sp. J132]|nr:hypothetical protein J132_00729 [Termitomyces sp. J132]